MFLANVQKCKKMAKIDQKVKVKWIKENMFSIKKEKMQSTYQSFIQIDVRQKSAYALFLRSTPKLHMHIWIICNLHKLRG